MIRNLFIRWLVLIAAIGLTAWLFPGITIHGQTFTDQLIAVAVIAVVFGLVNAILGPLLKLLTCSLVIVTLGLFALVINTGLFYLTAWLLPNFLSIDSFWAAFFGSLIISIVSTVLGAILVDD